MRAGHYLPAHLLQRKCVMRFGTCPPVVMSELAGEWNKNSLLLNDDLKFHPGKNPRQLVRPARRAVIQSLGGQRSCSGFCASSLPSSGNDNPGKLLSWGSLDNAGPLACHPQYTSGYGSVKLNTFICYKVILKETAERFKGPLFDGLTGNVYGSLWTYLFIIRSCKQIMHR